MRRSVISSVLTGILSVTLVACGKTNMASSPAAPDAAVAASAASATLSGTVSTGSGLGLASTTSGAVTGVTVSVVGSSATTPVDALGRFRLVITPSNNVLLKITGPGVDTTTTVGSVTAGDTIEITITVAGGAAEIEDSDRESGEGREIEGRVDSIPPATASGTFVVAGRTVTTTSATIFRHGDTTLTFADVKVGTRVHVKAAPSTGTTIVAREVNIQNEIAAVPGPTEPGDDHGHDGKDAEVSGAVSGLGGSCPAIHFSVGSTKVTTSSATRFDVACSAVTNTTRVEVKGTRAADGSIAATRVKRD